MASNHEIDMHGHSPSHCAAMTLDEYDYNDELPSGLRLAEPTAVSRRGMFRFSDFQLTGAPSLLSTQGFARFEGSTSRWTLGREAAKFRATCAIR